MIRKIIIYSLIITILSLSITLAKEESICIKMDDVGGSGNYPFNFRIIDNTLFAGGNLFNPSTHANTNDKVKEYLLLLKSMGVKNIIALHVPSTDTKENDFLKKTAKDLGLNFFEFPMNSEKVPTEKETKKIMELISQKAYIHCMWGADRTGAIIAKYLCQVMGYSGYEAWQAVITNGSHAGKMGGFKQIYYNKKLLLYFWPDAQKENLKIFKTYNNK